MTYSFLFYFDCTYDKYTQERKDIIFLQLN
jgi:hypothetical protein